MSRCLYCYQPLEDGETDFHKKCSMRIFGREMPPEIDTSLEEMEKLAKDIVIRSVALTGVQPKLSLTIEATENDPKKERFTIVGLWGNFILKPPTRIFPSLPENEDLTMHLASIFGIEAAEHTLIRLKSGELAYLTKRFDRPGDGRKLALEDMCQLSSKVTADKYHSSIEQVGKLILQHSSLPGYDASNFFELILFCFITGNADMHLKNFSLLSKTPTEIVLSPAYDLLCTALAMPDDKEEFALTLNARKNKIRVSDFDHLAKRLGINEIALKKIYQKLEKSILDMLNMIDISFLPADYKNQYKELLLSRAKRVLPNSTPQA
jgi:serine/threonine-protein kinase HipA